MSKQVIPFGGRILVRRRVIGEKIGSGLIVAAQQTAERPTDLADVVYVPDLSFADKEIIDNSEQIVKAMADQAKDGDSDAFNALLKLKQFLDIKSIRPGDTVFISKYVGTNFNDNKGGGELTMLDVDDVIGLVVNNE